MRSTAAALGAALALTVTALGSLPADGSASAKPDRGGDRSARALGLLETEARGSVEVSRSPSGAVRVVGFRGESADPAVGPAMTARGAARTHLARYGAALGLAGSRLVAGRTTHSVTGDDVVRFAQWRGGLRVIGGAVAVDLRPDRQLGSITASVSRARVAPASYPRRKAVQTALAAALKRPGHPARADLAAHAVRRLDDPAVLGIARSSDPATHARGVWRVVVDGGPTFRRLVLVDDRTGAVLQDVDLVERLDRVVCDYDNGYHVDSPCDHGFARTESDPPSASADVNSAFDLAGVVSDFYQQIGGIDLTDLIGIDVAGQKKLASSVRICLPGAECPLQNAFWNGVQMFYGDGFAGADDVVGHEMTHGVIQHNANLLYWGQSGAINESLADVMGEIIDHRHPGPGDSASSWTIGEDLPIGAIRSIEDPPLLGQPDTMTSPLYAGGIDDNGAVHTDSGVGNKAFYLISQGGTFGGRTIHGMDGPGLAKTATLYLAVIQHLVSGSDYADLAEVLEQSCADLASHHGSGFGAADCRSVHRATVATQMRTTPPAAAQPPDAPESCPAGAGRVRVLFDSEKGSPRSKFVTGPTWSRSPSADGPANAISGTHSWFSLDPEDIGTSALVARRPVALPAGRPVYLWFHQWRVLDFIGHGVFDAGTVGIADRSTDSRPRNAARLPWVNGPHNLIDDRYGNPAGGQLGFGRDSFGYVASRADLSSYAGHAVTPRFTMNTDNSVAFPGWYLDDIRVYTCGSRLVPTRSPVISGRARVGARLTASRGGWSLSGTTTRFQWRSGGHAVHGATGASYRVQRADLGHRITVRVTAYRSGRGHTATISPATSRVTRH
ncbi:M4 family metallopeptidase [Nocardioides cynanchi]|uniref:M4 family metallopeptidase n=1 Tax=Nocardioides cynanchi TaxID=2558918 RepID=UPI001245E0BE|nr:M4 family metallopeptidase [Nocardioides cynanchi]